MNEHERENAINRVYRFLASWDKGETIASANGRKLNYSDLNVVFEKLADLESTLEPAEDEGDHA